MAPSRVVVGLLASQYGVVWAVWIRGVVVGLSLSVPSLARVLAFHFHISRACMYFMDVNHVWSPLYRRFIAGPTQNNSKQ